MYKNIRWSNLENYYPANAHTNLLNTETLWKVNL